MRKLAERSQIGTVSGQPVQAAAQAGEMLTSIDTAAASAAPRKPAPKPAKRQPGSIVDQQARARGFAIDLSQGGLDEDDAAFGRAA
ncbi:hypothetical protein ACFQ15_05920 [Sphingomonas hankookensis]|uniref:hypothetical protein n=1 Tax=Sphingomonas hankookensis TaxID=563996 RepID=UPI001F56733A|nr:hypothetical protein [Sphingomonas hankookensis]